MKYFSMLVSFVALFPIISECVILAEYRILMPVSVDKLNIGRLYATAELSKSYTKNEDGVEIVANEKRELDSTHAIQTFAEKPQTLSQFTYKVYHIKGLVDRVWRAILPTHALNVIEKSWNAYPYCYTILSNSYMKDEFYVKVKSIHKKGNCISENIFNAESERTITYIDMTQSQTQKSGNDVTCVYKLFDVKFNYYMHGPSREGKIIEALDSLTYKLHKQIVVTERNWSDMTMSDIRDHEAKTKLVLDKLRKAP